METIFPNIPYPIHHDIILHNRIQSFFQYSFGDFLVLLGVLVLIVHFIAWFFKRYYLRYQREEIIKEVTKRIHNEVGETMKEIERNVKKSTEEIRGLYWHIVATYSYANKFYDHAVKMSLLCLKSFIQIKDYENFCAQLKNQTRYFLKEINRDNLNKIFDEMKTSEDEFIKKLKDLDVENKVSGEIDELQRTLKNVQAGKKS